MIEREKGGLRPPQTKREEEVIEPEIVQEKFPSGENTTAVVIRQLKQEIAKLQDEALMFESSEPTEKKLEVLQQLVEELTNLTTQVTTELYKKDPDQFQELIVKIERLLAKIESNLITFTAAVEIQYPKVSLFQKLALTVIAIVRGSVRESTLLRILGDNPAKRRALLGAAGQFRTVVLQHKGQLEEVKQRVQEEIDRPILLRQKKLLKDNERYQELIVKKRKEEQSISWDKKQKLQVNQLSVTELESIEKEMLQIEQETKEQVERELLAAQDSKK
ncbi:MAG: hypothetical protein WCW27_03095 [Patescibacteria group bacterium]|jgi:predicted metal-dependent enzyme (double-stranded beta helix superfamily)